MAVKEQSQRQLRVGQEIKKVIAAALERGEARSTELEQAFITITEVRVSPDLKYATAYVMTLNGRDLPEVLDKLNEEAWVFKKQIGAKLQLRYTPELNFKEDESFSQADKIEKLLRNPRVAKDLENTVPEESAE